MAQILWSWMYVEERQLISAWIPVSLLLPVVPALTSFRDVQMLLKPNKHFPLQVAFDHGVYHSSQSKKWTWRMRHCFDGLGHMDLEMPGIYWCWERCKWKRPDFRSFKEKLHDKFLLRNSGFHSSGVTVSAVVNKKPSPLITDMNHCFTLIIIVGFLNGKSIVINKR